jgi:hypothetical protein
MRKSNHPPHHPQALARNPIVHDLRDTLLLRPSRKPYARCPRNMQPKLYRTYTPLAFTLGSDYSDCQRKVLATYGPGTYMRSQLDFDATTMATTIQRLRYRAVSSVELPALFARLLESLVVRMISRRRLLGLLR